MDIETFKKLLLQAWCAETALGDWNPENPSLNQCAVTALVVQDYYGGKILRRKMTNNEYHYLNLLTDGTEIDLTSAQFSWILHKPILEMTSVCSRSQLTRHKNVVMRYDLLKSKVKANI